MKKKILIKFMVIVMLCASLFTSIFSTTYVSEAASSNTLASSNPGMDLWDAILCRWVKYPAGWVFEIAGKNIGGGEYKIKGKYYVFNNAGFLMTDHYWENVYYGKDGAKQSKYKGKWKSNSKGWWYEDATGWYPKNRYMTINGINYKFDKNGYAYWAAETWADKRSKIGTRLTRLNTHFDNVHQTGGHGCLQSKSKSSLVIN